MLHEVCLRQSASVCAHVCIFRSVRSVRIALYQNHNEKGSECADQNKSLSFDQTEKQTKRGHVFLVQGQNEWWSELQKAIQKSVTTYPKVPWSYRNSNCMRVRAHLS